jgi:hypothetical protein
MEKQYDGYLEYITLGLDIQIVIVIVIVIAAF